jgi:hypothetical protein
MKSRATADHAATVAQAAEQLLRQLEVASEALKPIYVSAWLHGVKYQGPTYLRAAGP